MAYPNPLPSSPPLKMTEIIAWMAAAGELSGSSPPYSLLFLSNRAHISQNPVKMTNWLGYSTGLPVNAIQVQLQITYNFPYFDLYVQVDANYAVTSNVSFYVDIVSDYTTQVSSILCYLNSGQIHNEYGHQINGDPGADSNFEVMPDGVSTPNPSSDGTYTYQSGLVYITGP